MCSAIPNENAPHTFEQWFNTKCFQANPTLGVGAANVVGNAGRGIIDGPPTKRVDFSLFKNIRFGERVALQLRGEAFNVFNNTIFRNLASTSKIAITSTTFGQIFAVRDPRTIQLGAKLTF